MNSFYASTFGGHLPPFFRGHFNRFFQHGDLPVLVGSRPTHVERDPKSTFLSIHILHVLTGCKFTPPCAILEYAKRSESANKNLLMVAESGADGHATELPAEELPQGGVFVRP